MTDAELAVILVAQVDSLIAAEPTLAPLVSQGLSLGRAFQPRAQGVASGPRFFYFVAGSRRVGFPDKRNVYIPPTPPETEGHFELRQLQQYEVRYQFMALIPQSPEDQTALSEHDALCALADIMAGERFRLALRAQGVGMLRITDVRNPYFTDDKDRFAADPSFDIVLTYPRQRVEINAPISAYDLNIKRV